MRTFLIFISLIFISANAYAWQCVSGKYIGKTWSVKTEMHNKQATLEVTKTGNKCLMKFSCVGCGSKEQWEVDNNKLMQRELDKDGKELAKYGATLRVRDGIEGFYIDCPSEGQENCDGSADWRTYWKIDTPEKKIIYSMWGVDPDNAADLNSKARKRYEYSFTYAP